MDSEDFQAQGFAAEMASCKIYKGNFFVRIYTPQISLSDAACKCEGARVNNLHAFMRV